MQKDFGKIGFILAAIGSSIGLGHIWRFPTATGTSGGSAFVLLFLGIALSIGITMLIAEMLIGQQGRKNVPDSFKHIAHNEKTPWRFMGLVLFAGPVTLTFYCAVLGWVLYYLVYVSFHLPSDFATSKAIFIFLLALVTNNETIGKMKLAKEVMIIKNGQIIVWFVIIEIDSIQLY